MYKKNIILILSSLGSLVLLIIRYNDYIIALIKYIDTNSTETAHNLLLFSPVVLFFSLLTYKMKPAVFTAWWRFARWSIPVIILSLFLINDGIFHSPYPGGFGWGSLFPDMLDMLISVILYVFFVIGSLVQIYRGRKRVKGDCAVAG